MDWPVCEFCNLVFDKFPQAEYQEVNKNPKFDANFNIQRQLEHLEYEMNRTFKHHQNLSSKFIKLTNNFQILNLVLSNI